MTNTSKQHSLITSFISQLIKKQNFQFPQKQIYLYCQQTELCIQKMQNIFNGYYERFKRTYQNLKQIIVLLFVMLVKLENKTQTHQSNMEYLVLGKSLFLLEDLITSKMFLVCLVSRKKSKQAIYQNFNYISKFLTILIPKLYQFEMDSQIMDIIQSCNRIPKAKNFITINFLVQSIFIQRLSDYLDEQSQIAFKQYLYTVLTQKKIDIFELLWNYDDDSWQNKIILSELAYLRIDIQCPQINYLQITQKGKIMSYQINYQNPEDWIKNAYQKQPSLNCLNSMNQQMNSLQIYQFLFKLQVFASSPYIQQLDILIPNDEFLGYFSKFLMGEHITNKQICKENSFRTIQIISNILSLVENVDPYYQQIVKNQITKILGEYDQEEMELETQQES